MSYDPQLGLVYIPVMDAPYILTNVAQNPGSTVKFVDSATHAAAVLPDKDETEDVTPLYGELRRFRRRTQRRAARLAALVLLAGIRCINGPCGSKRFAGLFGTRWRSTVHSRQISYLRGARMAISWPMPLTPGRVPKALDTGVATMVGSMTYEVGGTQYIAVMQGDGGGDMASFEGTAALRRERGCRSSPSKSRCT